MNKKDKLVYKIGMEDIIETIKEYTTMRQNVNISGMGKAIEDNNMQENSNTGKLEDILYELTMRYNTEIYDLYDLEQNRYINPIMKASVLDIINMILMSSINLDNNNAARIQDILDVSLYIKSKVTYEDFIYFQRKMYLSPLKDTEVVTILRRLMYVLSHLHHQRDISAIQGGNNPKYQNRINLYGGKFNTGLELWATTLSIATNKGRIKSKISPTLLTELNNELRDLKLDKYTKNILQDMDKLKKVMTVSDDLWFEREYAKNLFKDDIISQRVIDVEKYGNIKTIDRGMMEGKQYEMVGLYNLMVRGNKMFKSDTLEHVNNELMNGEVKIEVQGEIENIKWIKVRQYEDTTLPHKVIIVTYGVENADEGLSYKREFLVDTKDINRMYWLLSTEIDYTVLLIVLKYLGVLDKLLKDTSDNFKTFNEGLKEMNITLPQDKENILSMFRGIVTSLGDYR